MTAAVLAIASLGGAFATGLLPDLLREAEIDPDATIAFSRGKPLDREAYFIDRETQLGLLRGLDAAHPIDPGLRAEAIVQMDEQIARSPHGAPTHSWAALGPAPIPNGSGGANSGRVISIAIHPTNPDIVYVGTASGGLYRSTNGGAAWTPMMDNALSLSIGALALAPSNPEILYVGTGESNFSIDSFFGVGVYRITNPSGASPTLAGPFNLDSGSVDVFTGRSISEIQVHPTDPATIFVSTGSGIAGIGFNSAPTLPNRGVFRSTNATSGSPTFARLTNLAAGANVSVRDIAIDPLNPNLLVASVVSTTDGGIYRSTDALAATPGFARTFTYTGSSTSELTGEFAIHHTDAGQVNPTIYAGTGNLGGRVLISTDSGATWTQQIDNNFCTPQCFYNIAIEVAPNDATRVYIGGAPSVVFATSTTSGTAFTLGGSGVHVDSHVIAVSKSNPAIIYFGTDGGIYKSVNSGTSFTNLNVAGFSATQFQSMATHPREAQVMIGGTQDNGTILRLADQSWTRADGGDGGFTGIDQNSLTPADARMYHTYFNAADLQGYATRVGTSGSWTFRGCQAASTTANGITCTPGDAILFYAPLALGPGNPNTVYYGSDRLYRSNDTGTTHTVVSQAPISTGVAISAIAIAPSNDNVRFVGQTNGGLFRVTDGSNTMVSVDPVGAGSVIPDRYIGRIAIHPTDPNIAYVALSGFPGAGLSIFKTTNLLAATPTFAAAATNIPNIPVNALAIDPANPTIIYAGTDIGVFRSEDSAATWDAFSTNLPRVPVFGMAFQSPLAAGGPGKLRIATHGRGIFELTITNVDTLFSNGFE